MQSLVIQSINCLFEVEMPWFRRLLKGPNFMPWFQRRHAVAENEQHKLWRQARMKTDIHRLISKMPELEVFDCFNAIERHLLGEIQVILPFYRIR